MRRDVWRFLLHSAMLAVFLCVPLWYRLPAYLPIFTSWYVTRFLIFVLMVIAVGLWLLSGARGLRVFARKRWRALWALALLALVIWGFASTGWAFIRRLHPEVGGGAALQLGIVVLFTVTVACSGLSPRAIIVALVVGLVANTLITFGQTAAQSALGLSMFGELGYSEWESGASYVRAGDLAFLRPYGLLPHPNMLAGVLVIGLLAATAWLLSKRRWQRVVGVVLFPAGVYALLLTFSRAAWGAFALAALLIVPFLWRHLQRVEVRRSLGIAFVLTLAAVVLFVASYRPLLAARAGEGQESIELRSVSDRIVFTQFAFQAIAESPLLGVGIGNFPWRASYYLRDTFYDLRGEAVHNIYLSAWSEMGTIGLALFLAAMVFGGVAALKAIRVPKDDRNYVNDISLDAVSPVVGAGLRPAPAATLSSTSHHLPDPARIALFGVFIALAAVGMLDHYPYTTIQFQTVWWGCLAGALAVPQAEDGDGQTAV